MILAPSRGWCLMTCVDRRKLLSLLAILSGPPTWSPSPKASFPPPIAISESPALPGATKNGCCSRKAFEMRPCIWAHGTSPESAVCPCVKKCDNPLCLCLVVECACHISGPAELCRAHMLPKHFSCHRPESRGHRRKEEA